MHAITALTVSEVVRLASRGPSSAMSASRRPALRRLSPKVTQLPPTGQQVAPLVTTQSWTPNHLAAQKSAVLPKPPPGTFQLSVMALATSARCVCVFSQVRLDVSFEDVPRGEFAVGNNCAHESRTQASLWLGTWCSWQLRHRLHASCMCHNCWLRTAGDIRLSRCALQRPE